MIFMNVHFNSNSSGRAVIVKSYEKKHQCGFHYIGTTRNICIHFYMVYSLVRTYDGLRKSRTNYKYNLIEIRINKYKLIMI